MTTLEKEIQSLPRLQKISIMEQIWADLLKDEESIGVPEWHLRELEATELSIKAGQEHFQVKYESIECWTADKTLEK